MVYFKYGGKRGKRFSLGESKDLVVVRTRRPAPLSRVPLSRRAQQILAELTSVERFPEAGVEILSGRKASAEEARAVLKKESEIRFVGRVLSDRRSKAPVTYTENFFVKFENDAKPRECKSLLKKYRLSIKRQLTYAQNAYFVAAKEGTGQRVFDIGLKLLAENPVELCHPELVRQVALRGAFPQQWHLKRTTIAGNQVNAHANVVSAWPLSEGDGTVIAIIDNGFDLEHEEFVGAGKIVAARDVTRRNSNPRPRSGDNHGTACAGVACANGRHGAAGVAPKARLMPIRLSSGLGSQAEADAFIWAAENGADVISCSWGPVDGIWWDPNDPTHDQVVPLPDSTRLAIDFAVLNGRNGKGCVITWAAGNGNESVDNDGYASYDKVIAVAACNDQGRKSAYSDFGDALWCAFPSSNGLPSLTPGIWTTDRSGGPGYNDGDTDLGDVAGNYTNSFGGTSSACPGVAGVAAIVLARNPSLRWDEVKDVLKRCCDKIDAAGGNYGADGSSRIYGYGRLNAKTAVNLALPTQPRRRVNHSVTQDVAIRDFKKSLLSLALADTKPIAEIRIGVDIEHTFVGDLIVRILPPQGAPVTLHDRTGGPTDNLKLIYDVLNTPALAVFQGASPQGTWTLEVQDKARDDTGTIRGFSIELTF